MWLSLILRSCHVMSELSLPPPNERCSLRKHFSSEMFLSQNLWTVVSPSAWCLPRPVCSLSWTQIIIIVIRTFKLLFNGWKVSVSAIFTVTPEVCVNLNLILSDEWPYSIMGNLTVDTCREFTLCVCVCAGRLMGLWQNVTEREMS